MTPEERADFIGLNTGKWLAESTFLENITQQICEAEQAATERAAGMVQASCSCATEFMGTTYECYCGLTELAQKIKTIDVKE